MIGTRYENYQIDPKKKVTFPVIRTTKISNCMHIARFLKHGEEVFWRNPSRKKNRTVYENMVILCCFSHERNRI